MLFYVIIFIVSIFVLAWLSSRLIDALVQIAKYLRWREFITAFFIMAFATSLTNLFVDINAVFHGIPELAFGDIVGGNLVDLTLVMAIAVFFGKKWMPAKSNMVQSSAVFTTVIAILPLILVWDKRLDRVDGIILFIAFAVYVYWIFSKEERFKKVYQIKNKKPIKDFSAFLKNLAKIIVLLALLLLASQGVIKSAMFFADSFGASFLMVGILIVGLGNCFPEMYFSIISARRGQNWMILGELMGSVIVCSTLVLGIIAIISPFEIKDLSPFFIARIFMIIAALFFLWVIKTGQKITKKEGVLLLFVYIVFLLSEIFSRI